MPKVSEIPFDELEVGDVCISTRGNLGEITELHPETTKVVAGEPIYRYNDVTIRWKNGNISQAFHIDCDRIDYVGRC